MNRQKLTILIILFLSFRLFSQSNEIRDFIVTSAGDTIYVDKIKKKNDKIIVKKDKKKTKYSAEKIQSYYLSKKNEYYEKVISPFVVKDNSYDSKSDRYDYRKREMSFLKEKVDNNRVNYTFLQRLTNGKVKLFSYTIKQAGGVITPSNPIPTPGNSDTSYYIAVYDSKPERIELDSFFGNKLKYEAYSVLRLYLNENKEILSKLDSLYQSKHKGMIKRILEIINEYNRWLELKK